MGMKSLVVVMVVVACSGPQKSGGGDAAQPVGVVKDTRSEIERRRETACEALKPKLVQCTVDAAKAELDAGRLSQKQFDEITAQPILDKHGANWMKGCDVEMSSRQVRVLEVCFEEEQECGPLLSCLEHLKAQPAK
jgi:hypothetical protein